MLTSISFSRGFRRMSTSQVKELQNFVHNGRKIVGAALNYMDIIKARNLEVPEVPLMFFKPTSSFIQEGQDIVIPSVFTKVAHEVELGFIIGKTCKNVTKEEAMNYVGGYCLALDLTAQCQLGEARTKGHPWSLGKGFDTSTPVSKFIPATEVSDPHNLRLWLKVNNEMRQEGNTADLVFKIPELIAHTSKYMTLEPNDLILTGTPDGAAPLSPGDIIECGMGEVANLKFKVKSE